jgi:hypothetical protein
VSIQQSVTKPTQVDTDNLPASERRRGRSGQPPTPPGENSSHAGGSLTRVTANFTPRAMGSLDGICDQTGDSRTDVLNRAVMVYETILELLEEGDRRSLRIEMPNGEIRILQFIG